MPAARSGAILLVLAAGLVLAGCAGDAEPAPMTQQQLDAFGAAYDQGAMTVGDAVQLAPTGMVGMIDVRIAAGIGAVEEVVHGAPPADFHDWPVVALCFYPQDVPSIEVAAVPPSHEQAFVDAQGFELMCDGPPELH
jgi:hypothetical protein